MNEMEPQCQWERGEGGRECGNKEGKKRKEMERGSFAQPSITFLGFKFIWLHFGGGGNTPHTGEGEQTGGWREREEDGGRKQHGEREEEGKGVIYGGGKLPGSERVKREAVREEWRGGPRSQEKGDDMRREGTEKGDIWVKKCLCTYKSSNM